MGGIDINNFWHGFYPFWFREVRIYIMMWFIIKFEISSKWRFLGVSRPKQMTLYNLMYCSGTNAVWGASYSSKTISLISMLWSGKWYPELYRRMKKVLVPKSLRISLRVGNQISRKPSRILRIVLYKQYNSGTTYQTKPSRLEISFLMNMTLLKQRWYHCITSDFRGPFVSTQKRLENAILRIFQNV